MIKSVGGTLQVVSNRDVPEIRFWLWWTGYALHIMQPFFTIWFWFRIRPKCWTAPVITTGYFDYGTYV